MASKRNALALTDKMKVLDYSKKNPDASTRKMAEVFGCGRTQIQMILKNQESIRCDFEQNTPSSRKRTRKPLHEDIDSAVHEWYCLARQRLVPVTGPMLQEEALIIATNLGISDFKASNGWLQRFKDRNNIKQLVVSGESGDVREETVVAWHERLMTLTRGYAPEDIWNEDETGCFFQALPEKSLADTKKACKGGKKAKIQVTIAFFANAAGGKELPIVIGKAATPRCFKGIRDKKKPLGIPYYFNKKSWMDSVIMLDILTTLNRRLQRQRRNILLFVDNVSSHSPDFIDKFSNLKIVFLPANTTSRLQPLDASIIKNFKTHYRKLLVKHVLTQINSISPTESVTATSITKTVDILLAIRWIKKAWDAVSSQTIIKCFIHCGILPCPIETADPFADLDNKTSESQDNEELEGLVQELGPDSELTADQYVIADEDLPTCDESYDTNENWREELRNEVLSNICDGPSKSLETCESDSDNEELEVEVESPPSKVNTFKEAIDYGYDLIRFLTEKGEEEISESVFKIIQQLQDSQLIKHTRQLSIQELFQCV